MANKTIKESIYLMALSLVNIIMILVSFFVSDSNVKDTLLITLSIYTSSYFITKAIENNGTIAN